MLLELLIGLVLALVAFLATAAVVAAWMSLPLADVLNRFLRDAGLAGPSPGSRAAGGSAAGVVASRFDVRGGSAEGRGKVFAGGELWNATCPARLARELEEGDRVDVVYGDDLTVRVLGRTGGAGAEPGRDDG